MEGNKRDNDIQTGVLHRNQQKEDQQLLLPQQAEKNMLGIDVNASKIAVSIIITSGKKDTQTALPWQAYRFYTVRV
jgi:hypothetical protein